MKKVLFLSALVVLASVISINDAFAVTYKDDTGYIPKWAEPLDDTHALNLCGYITTPGQDMNWCNDFGVYVNQQINSQQGTKHNLSLSGECVGTRMYGKILENGKDSNLDGSIKIINEIGSTVDTIGLRNGQFVLVNYVHYSKIQVYYDESQNVILDLKCNPEEVLNENQQLKSQQPIVLNTGEEISPSSISAVENQTSDKGKQDANLITLDLTVNESTDMYGTFTPEQNSGWISLGVKGKVSSSLFKDPTTIQRVKVSILDTIANPQLTTKGDYSVTLHPTLTLGETYKIQVEYNGHTAEKLFKFDEIYITRTQPKSQTTQSSNSEWDIQEKVNRELKNEKNKISGKAVILIYSNTYWSGTIANGDGSSSTKDGGGDAKYVAYCGSINLVQGLIQKQTAEGFVTVVIIQNGKIIGTQSTSAAYGIAHATGQCLSVFGGGCLIATATYGSELAPQVQKLRELRDNTMLQTESGTSFIAGFNQFYYSFSPTIADWERESPVFKEAVKIMITPMINSLSILNYVDMDSEDEVLGYGISLILLNLGMYFVVPIVVVHQIRKKF